jgi:hypothetical protein
MDQAWRHFLLILFILLLTACAPATQDVGILEGHVTIGPLTPAVQGGVPEPTPSPEIYAARQIVVVRERDGKEVERLTIDANGNYFGELPVGTYVVDINHLGIDSANGFPKVVEIVANRVIRLNVDIDTGIR